MIDFPDLTPYFPAAVAEACRLVAAVDDAALTADTPCTDWQVRQLLNHLFQVVREFTDSSPDADLDFSDSSDFLVGDWRADFAVRAQVLAAAWQRPGVVEGTTAQGMPMLIRAGLPVLDLTLHGWDLSRAIGRSFHCDRSHAEAAWLAMRAMAPMREGSVAFATEVPVAADAPVLDRLLGLAGRDPAWSRD